MIINEKQLKRLSKLFFLFIAYANDRLFVTDNLCDRSGYPDEHALYDVAQEVWAGEKHTSLVADYVRDNPDRLSRTDLKEVAQWEHALAGVFLAQRRGNDVLFSIPDYAIAVRGIGIEIDDMVEADFPVLASTILLPFEGIIVFTFIMHTLDVGTDPTESLNELITRCAITPDSRIIRSARDFVKYADALLSITPQHSFDEYDDNYDDLDPDLGPDDDVQGQHHGLLAGLKGKDRLSAKERFREEHKDQAIAETFDAYLAISAKRRPPANIRELYGQLDRQSLVSFARKMGYKDRVSSLSKQRLLDLMMPDLVPTKKETLSLLQAHGLSSILWARELAEAGGLIELTEEDAIKRGELVPAITSVFGYRATNTTLLAFMLQETVECLADVDWEAEIERNHRVEKARRFLNTVVEMRGVDVLEEVNEEFLAFAEDTDLMLDEEDLKELIWDDAYVGTTGFEACIIDGIPLLVNGCLVDEETGEVDTSAVHRIIKLQVDKPKRPVTPDMLEHEYFCDWLEETVEEVQDLLAYLDEHVPDTQPDTVFADKLADCVLIEAQLPDRGPHYASTLSRFDFYTTEAQVDRFIDLTVQASNHRPLWSNRGWTVGEMRHLIDTGE